MTDDNQEMEMEDILSSIKNILEEDEQNRATEPVAESEDALDDVLLDTAEIDDILELSPEMRVDDMSIPTENSADEPEITTDNLLSEPSEPVEQNQDVASATAVASAVPDDLNSDDAELSLMNDVSVIEPHTELEITSEPEPIFAPELPAKPEIASEPEPIFAPELPAEPEIASEPEPIFAPELPAEPEVTSEPKPIFEEKSQASDNIIDASANIISNFAKMFSREEPTVAAPAADITAPVITGAGDTGKTLEEFVIEAIQRAIGKDIKSKWQDGADYRTYAEAEINRQIGEWLNSNLSTLVEKIVKQEIERVIAKVGS